jgi:nucleotide-binding universal stress UspA family protein
MRDIALHIDTYAEPIPPEAIDQAVGFAGMFDATLAGIALHIDINVPTNWLAEKIVHVSQLAADEERKSLEAAQASLKHLEAAAARAGVKHAGQIVRALLHRGGPCMAELARTRDLCLLVAGYPMDSQRSVAEDVIFGAGRPALIFHPERAPLPSGSLASVAIAWDGSRSAARAVADALPILKKAGDIRVMTAIGEKASATSGQAGELVRHLRMHDIAAVADELDGRNRSIGASIDAYLEERSPQLLVMGAYGSSRFKEFVLGGATVHVLNSCRTPVLLSH